ncbi:MAG: hypothetical protein VKJ04_02900 [Vampirovibrionales bacterium]|nr:hypothetical protein [Vampirovibrionales bacterium]
MPKAATIYAEPCPETHEITDDFDAFVIGTYKRWSASAVECYLREGRCEGCYYERFFADKPYECKMKLSVEQLLDTLGKPRSQLLERVPS